VHSPRLYSSDVDAVIGILQLNLRREQKDANFENRLDEKMVKVIKMHEKQATNKGGCRCIEPTINVRQKREISAWPVALQPHPPRSAWQRGTPLATIRRCYVKRA
jgi:hypothetical protein